MFKLISYVDVDRVEVENTFQPFLKKHHLSSGDFEYFTPYGYKGKNNLSDNCQCILRLKIFLMEEEMENNYTENEANIIKNALINFTKLNFEIKIPLLDIVVDYNFNDDGTFDKYYVEFHLSEDINN